MEGENLGGGRRRGRHDHLAAGVGQKAQNVALDAIVDGDDAKLRRPLARAIARAEPPARLAPIETLLRADRRHEVHPVYAGPGGGLGAQPLQIEAAVRRMGDDRIGHALVANERGERARVDAIEADDSARREPARQRRLRAVVRGLGGLGGEDRAERAGAAREIDGLDVLVIRADIADMRKGEGDDLPGVGGIGQNLLISGHRRVEADLADRLALSPDAEALERLARGEHQHARLHRLQPTLFFSLIHARARSMPVVRPGEGFAPGLYK